MSSDGTPSLSQLSLGKHKWNFSYVTAISVFIIELFLYSPLLSFGVFLPRYVQNEIYTIQNILWVPVMYIASWKFSNPWSKDIAETFEDNHIYQKWITVTSTVLISAGVGLACKLQNIFAMIFLYSCVTGVAASFINAQIKALTFDDFQSKRNILECVRQFARAIGMFVVPHVIFQLQSEYAMTDSEVIYSAILLNILPPGLILSRKKKTEVKQNLNRYRTVSGQLDDSNSIEMSSLKTRFLPYNNEAYSYTNKLSNIFNPGEDDDDDLTYAEECEEINSKSNRRNKTQTGVEIMPQIEEESETDSEDCNTSKKDYRDSIKRYSKISQQFEEAILRTNGVCDSKQASASNNPLLDVKSIGENITTKVEAIDDGSSPVPGVKKTYRKTHKHYWDFLKKHVFKPLQKSFRVFYFYPALFTRSTTQLMGIIFISLAPELVLIENNGYTEIEAVFLLTIAAFSWLLFLISLTWLLNVSITKLRVVNAIGLSICTLCFFLLSSKMSHETITIACFFFGCGYGIIAYTEDIIIRETLGITKSAMVEGTLDTLSGIFVILIYFIIYMLDFKLQYWFSTFAILCTINLAMWTILPLSKFFWYNISRCNKKDALVISIT